MLQQSTYSQLSAILVSSLNLQQSPVAISFSNSIPAEAADHPRPVPAGCRFWQDGARSVLVTSSADHSLCAIGVYTHHLEESPAQQKDLMDALKVFAELDYVRAEDLASVPVLGSQYRYVVYAPLAECPLPPDVVILFVNARQMLILSEATQQVENQNAPALGRPACAIVPQVMNTGRAALSLGCCGARAYLDLLTEEVAVFALPGQKLEAYVKRIEVLSRANSVLSDSIKSAGAQSTVAALHPFRIRSQPWRLSPHSRRRGNPVLFKLIFLNLASRKHLREQISSNDPPQSVPQGRQKIGENSPGLTTRAIFCNDPSSPSTSSGQAMRDFFISRPPISVQIWNFLGF